MDRRSFLAASAALASTPAFAATPVPNLAAKFDSDLAKALANTPQLTLAAQYRERQLEDLEFLATRAPRPAPSTRNISPRAIKMIVDLEVTSEANYKKKLRGITWPGGQSGITIGIGYDVGYVSKEWLHDDWDGIAGVAAADVTKLEQACGVTGKAAQQLGPTLTGISIDWQPAYGEFSGRVLPLYTATTVNALHNTDKLSDDSLGALVSLVYNRGASFAKPGDRYVEMRNIARLMVLQDFKDIPDQIKSMARLWANDPNLQGLVTRRYLEAELFQLGLTP